MAGDQEVLEILCRSEDKLTQFWVADCLHAPVRLAAGFRC